MKFNSQTLPDTIDPQLNLSQVRDECLELVKKRAYASAGAAIVPIPFFDVLIDLGMLAQMIPDINARFGLAREHTSVYDPETKTIHWNELRKRGFELSGLVFARTAVKKSFNGLIGRIVTAQVTKFIPLGGQVVSATLGYLIMRKIAEAHVNECFEIATQIQQKSQQKLARY